MKDPTPTPQTTTVGSILAQLDGPRSSAEVAAACRFDNCRKAEHCQTMPCKHRMMLRDELYEATDAVYHVLRSASGDR